jgi:hypothetical protein
MKCRDSKPQILKRLFIPSTNTHTHIYKDWFPISTSIFLCHDQTKESQSQFWNLWNFQIGKDQYNFIGCY